MLASYVLNMMNLGKQSHENQVNRFLKELWSSIARNTSVLPCNCDTFSDLFF